MPPSIQSLVDNILSWFNRYRALIPITSIDLERVRFDTQLLQNLEITGLEYQQGILAGYEVREYLLEKWAANAPTATRKMSRSKLSIFKQKAGAAQTGSQT